MQNKRAPISGGYKETILQEIGYGYYKIGEHGHFSRLNVSSGVVGVLSCLSYWLVPNKVCHLLINHNMNHNCMDKA